MATPTRGARLLQQLMDADPEAADKLRVAIDRPAMWRLLKAERIPGLKRALLIEELTKGRIPVSAWAEVDESAPGEATPPPAEEEPDKDKSGPHAILDCGVADATGTDGDAR